MESKDKKGQSQRDFVRYSIQTQLSSLNSSSGWFRNMHYRTQISTVVLSALITTVAGLKSSPFLTADVASNIVLFLGSLTTVVSAWGAFFSPRDSWHLTAEFYCQLRALEAKLEFQERDSDFSQKEKEVLTQIFAEYQKIIDDYNRKWQDLRKKQK